MRRHGGTPKRYAKALFLVAQESGRVEVVAGELAALLEITAAAGRLKEFLLRPWIKG